MSKPRHVTVGAVTVGNDLPLVLIAGPCALESRAHALEVSQALVEMTSKLGLGLSYQTSVDKANRTRAESARGIGLADALPSLAEIRETRGCPVLTDVHEPGQCGPVAEAVDVLQIPAFLCRQTDLLVAAAKTGKVVNVKKGQFLAPQDMEHVVGKLQEGGAPEIWLTERGTTFGYRNLVVDMRGFELMKETGHPVIFDATHSVQLPSGGDGKSDGQREFVPPLARAALAAGAQGLFLETHPDPDQAISDGPNMVPLAELPNLVAQVFQIWKLMKSLAPS